MGSFFNKPEIKRFHIEPRYWDPAKERSEERIQRAKADLGIVDENTPYIPNIKGKFSSNMKDRYNETSNLRRKSNFRLLIIAALLFLVAYFYIYGSDAISQFIK